MKRALSQTREPLSRDQSPTTVAGAATPAASAGSVQPAAKPSKDEPANGLSERLRPLDTGGGYPPEPSLDADNYAGWASRLLIQVADDCDPESSIPMAAAMAALVTVASHGALRDEQHLRGVIEWLLARLSDEPAESVLEPAVVGICRITTGRPPLPIDSAALREALLHGLSLPNLAQRFAVSPAVLRRRLRKLGLPTPEELRRHARPPGNLGRLPELTLSKEEMPNDGE